MARKEAGVIPILIYYSPSNPRLKYQTISSSDPNIPTGYLDSQGSDGATPEALKIYSVGINSGGFPKYTGDVGQATSQPNWPNGILNSPSGNKVKT